ncbi:MAG: DNA-packaging protein [Candidatus Pacearchaeota archaeon]|nr:DNA-packaging protein [Candidatus Pacearchaeota archaeon]
MSRFKKFRSLRDLLKRVDEYLKSFEEDEAIPTIEGLALFVGCTRDNIYQLERKYPKLKSKLDILRDLQTKRLITRGLLKKYDSRIVRLLLSTHGYVEKKEVEYTEKPYISLEDEGEN